MRNVSILPDKFKSFEYYINKLPLYLRNSYGFIEHYRIWYDLMIGENENGLINVSDTILYLMDIFDDNYLVTIRDLTDSGSTGDTDYGSKCDILDKIAALFGVTRNFSITYYEDNEEIKEELSLNNEDLLLLIKGQIIKNYCEGSYDQIKGYYNDAGLVVYVITAEADATSHIYLAEPEGSMQYSENVKKMFKSGLLRIESMGITYRDSTTELTGFLKWDSSASVELWDVGVWAI